jgi:hypothetical protein
MLLPSGKGLVVHHNLVEGTTWRDSGCASLASLPPFECYPILLTLPNSNYLLPTLPPNTIRYEFRE